ncbi:MAG: alpha/beta hydrolase fold domain-containing protein [Acidobacteriota bacterium]|nr:alpha/beta hydrolase fold domain-containing protein [Acidobacteriota bacterium]
MRSFLVFVLATAAMAQNPPAVPDTVVADRDVEYSAVGGRQTMDIIRPRGTATAARPTVLLVHGGGFRAGTKEGYIPLAVKLAERGYVAATVTYRLAPRNQFPAAVHDVKAAVRFLRANATKYGTDPDHIGALGGSAGGHLVLMLGLTAGVEEFEGSGPNREQSSRVQCVVDEYGPTDFTQSYSKSVDAAEVLPKFLGGDLDHNRLAHMRSSPLNWVTPNAAPTLAIHGTADPYVAYEQSLWLVERLIAAGVPAELESITGAGHGFKGADAQRADDRAFAWLDKYLKPTPAVHTLLISDHGPNGEIAAIEWPSGKVLWKAPNDHGHDVQSLPNSHVLFTINPQKKVVEIDAGQKEVWSYSEGLEHPIAAQRLANGNTLIGDARLGRLVEVTPDKRVVWKYENADLANMRSRNSHRTDQGTTLIAIEAEGKLIEVDQAGKTVWQWQAPNGANRKLYQGRRLANGNTVMSLSDPGEVVEVDPSGRIVRSIGGTDPAIQLGWVSGFTFLPEGGMLLNDYTGRRIIEVDAKGKSVNEWRTGSRTIASIDLIR